MARLNAGELVARSLKLHGVTKVFGLSGGHIDPSWWAAQAAGLQVLDMRHENAAAFAAEGWALATGQPGVCLVTAGPGLTNAATGLATAMANGSPMLCIAGAATLRGFDSGEVETLDQLAFANTVCKWARRIYHLDRIPEYVAMALREAVSGRPGPVYLEIAIDLHHSDIEEDAVAWPSLLPAIARRLAPPEELVIQAAEVLATAERPVVVAGSGVWWSGAGDALRRFIEHVGIPVVTRRQGRGVIADDHSLCFGRDWQGVIAQADTVVLVGTQLDYFFGYGKFPHLKATIQIDINPNEIGRNCIPVSVAMVGDARSSLEALTSATKPLELDPWLEVLREYAAEIATAKRPLEESASSPIHPLRLCAEIEATVGRNATIITDGANNLMWTSVGLRAFEAGRQPSMGPLGTIGHGVAYALAAKCARPDEPALWVVGDGSFGFHAMELDTSARLGLPIVTVVMNNRGWSATWVPLGERRYDLLAPGFNGDGAFIEHPEQIRPALERALASTSPSILNVMVDPAPEYFSGRRFAK